MTKEAGVVRTLNWLTRIDNALICSIADLEADKPAVLLSDLSIFYGPLFPTQVEKTAGNMFTAGEAGLTTIPIITEMGRKGPIEIVIPPYTIVELIHNLNRRANNYEKLLSDEEYLSSLATRAQGFLTADESDLEADILSALKVVPNSADKAGIKTLVDLVGSPKVNMCGKHFGKDVLIEAHRRSEGMKHDLYEVFENTRKRKRTESPNDFHLRNLADAENLAITPYLDDSIDKEHVLYAGPIPSRGRILESQRKVLNAHQRGYMVPFLITTVFKRNNFGTEKKSRRMAIKELKSLANTIRDVQTEMNPYTDWLDVGTYQYEKLQRALHDVGKLRKLNEPYDRDKEKEEIANLVKSNSTLKDSFGEHAENLRTAISKILQEASEFDDEEILEEFSLRELRDKGEADWLLPKKEN